MRIVVELGSNTPSIETPVEAYPSDARPSASAQPIEHLFGTERARQFRGKLARLLGIGQSPEQKMRDFFEARFFTIL